MGWTEYHAKFYKPNGQVDRKAEMDNLYTWETQNTKVSVVKSRMVGSTYYAAVKIEQEGEPIQIIGAVALTSGINRRDPYFNFGYKGMEETCRPYYYDCPKAILDLLTPTDNEWALKWRQKCREKQQKPKLSDLPVGTIIRYTNYNGDVIRLEKMAPNYQFKRCWWYKADTNNYVPVRRIPDVWEKEE